MTQPFVYPATLLCDFYKVSHKNQYPKGTELVYSTWTARTSRLETIDRVVAFGFQAFIKEYLIHYFNEHFFARAKEEVTNEYKRVIQYALGTVEPDASHIEELHDLGYLPIRIKAVKEGTLVPVKVPMLTIENTKPAFFWLTNYLETLMSCQLWMPTTSATLAFEYRKILEQFAKETSGDTSGVPFQGHDFSMRGMGSLEAAK
ncbi:nicotinamide phosphoribosyltransferase domain-containing protein, partial [Paenibacillus sepulcri]|nr:nicotinamide phosphoribosyltransferase domain-containing protein [Paenibacillus sepulcri]